MANENKTKYLFKVENVAIKQFDEIIGHLSGETIATTPGRAYTNFLSQARTKLRLSQGAKLSFDKTKIVQVRVVLTGEFGWRR